MSRISSGWNKLIRFPWSMLAVIVLLCSIGFVMMYSAGGGNIEPWLTRQLMHFGMFIPVMLVISVIDIRIWFRYAYVIYGVVLCLLVVVEVAGHTAMGATRWINLGFMKLQPSELMKLALVFGLSRYFHGRSLEDIFHPFFLIPPLLLVLAPFGLILIQPDLGTAGILLMVGGIIFFMAGVKAWKFWLIIASGLGAAPLSWHFLHDYQRQRVLTFLNPEQDPLGSGYNIIQSIIAIGSGGISGKGMLQGSQSQLRFLPEHQTDFIFTMLNEEWGLIGGVTVLSLVMLLLLITAMIALQSRNYFGKLICCGVGGIFFLHVFINAAMVMGLIPVVGAPFPFLSYGGTIMMTMLVGFGFVANISIHRHSLLSRHSKEGW
jgi:rod shape determining protein RodA